MKSQNYSWENKFSHEIRLEKLQSLSLEEKRSKEDVTDVYKISKGLDIRFRIKKIAMPIS